jgi:hypothetical protein
MLLPSAVPPISRTLLVSSVPKQYHTGGRAVHGRYYADILIYRDMLLLLAASWFATVDAAVKTQ